MSKSYNSYVEASLLNRAMAARRESNHLFCMPIIFEGFLDNKLYNGERYITPVQMAGLLDCDTKELCEAMSKHKRAIYDINRSWLLSNNYGNANFEVSYTDKIYFQGWINFLSLPCFADSLEAKKAVKLMTDQMWEDHEDEQDELMFEGIPEEAFPTIDLTEHEALINRKRNLH